MRCEPSDSRRAHPESASQNFLISLLAVCLSVLLSSCEGGGTDVSAGPAAPKPVYVELVQIQPELLRHEVALTGQFEAESSVTMRPEVDGVVASVEFVEGSPAAQGDLLFRLRNDEQRARLTLVEAELKLAQDVYDRTQRLNLQDISALARMSEATAKLDEARARVTLAKVVLEKTMIRAPFDGVTGMRLVNVGERVEEGDPLVHIAAIDRLQLLFTVQSMAFDLGRVGAMIHARVFTYPGERFEGEVFFVSPTVDPATRRMVLKAWVPNQHRRLKPGMFANVDIEVAQRENALVVPETALVYDRNGTYIWRVGPDQKAEKIPVRIGLRMKGRVEIVEGIQAGDRIVSVGVHKLNAGSLVADARGEVPTHAGAREPEPVNRGQGEES